MCWNPFVSVGVSPVYHLNSSRCIIVIHGVYLFQTNAKLKYAPARLMRNITKNRKKVGKFNENLIFVG